MQQDLPRQKKTRLYHDAIIPWHEPRLGGGFRFFLFSPYLEKWSTFTHIFQMGWFNHQLEDNGNVTIYVEFNSIEHQGLKVESGFLLVHLGV